MRGRIVKRGNSWGLIFEEGTDPVTGKRKQGYVTFHGRHQDAEKRLAKILTELDNGTYVRSDKTTLAEYLKNWLKDYCWPNLSPRSAETYEYLVKKHIVPAIGAIPLTTLKPKDLQRLYAEKLAAGLSNRTVIYIHTAMHKSLRTALRMGMVSRNVADAVDPPRLIHHEMKTMSPDDIERFLALAKETPYYALFYTLLTTGLRRGEALALQWGDIDLLGAELSVKRSLQHLEDGRTVIAQPKTEKSARTISISPSTALVLGKHRGEEERKYRALKGAHSDDEKEQSLPDESYVFCGDSGEPYRPDSISHAFKKTAKRAGLQGIHLHSARHSMASLMLKANIHPLTISRMLGHSNIQTTLNIYSHLSPGMEAAAAARLDEFMPAAHNEAKSEALKTTP